MLAMLSALPLGGSSERRLEIASAAITVREDRFPIDADDRRERLVRSPSWGRRALRPRDAEGLALWVGASSERRFSPEGSISNVVFVVELGLAIDDLVSSFDRSDNEADPRAAAAVTARCGALRLAAVGNYIERRARAERERALACAGSPPARP